MVDAPCRAGPAPELVEAPHTALTAYLESEACACRSRGKKRVVATAE